MKCPIDDTDLVMSDRQGIEIDYCPKCRGVWLDRGELDKIIERSEPERPRETYREPERHYGREHYGKDHHHRPYKKKKSILGEIFDF